jgi:thymidylate synthase (FAD)
MQIVSSDGHTTVSLVAVTRPVGEALAAIGSDSPEQFIAYAARVSNPGNQSMVGTALALLRYLMRHAHWSPFEMAHAVIKVTTTRDMGRQAIRHRSFAYQEFSQRYAAAMRLVRRRARRQDWKNRQASHDDLPRWKRWVWAIMQEAALRLVAAVYTAALRLDIAKECARGVLPETTETTYYMAGSIRSWIHYIELRDGNGTQEEHAIIARLAREALASEFPALFGEE